ncbi:FAD-dependent oxidoreductase [Pelagibacterium luteolum]|uniref:Glycine/D-amino acid oxidase n=1 Tax=Pelagibacterium luteolum TaxID=440168 RepID=A0A1G7XVQ4_9HYPH|nr:FAD-dependent oxidoreductase [Pelagibacterium luteolum]SDG88234.1 Glycine/D-amino acid oxidase [Pelagibacterium luteolum]
MIETRSKPASYRYDAIIIGAGFYGCALAVHLAQKGQKVLVCEIGSAAMLRASKVNQARVHTGFHYPRSFATSMRSRHSFERFAYDYAGAIKTDFQMLYAIARYRTKVNARRFEGMFRSMNAPLERATMAQRALFSAELVEDVFSCTEYAFDYSKIKDILFERLARLDVEISFQTKVERVEPHGDEIAVRLAGGATAVAPHTYNIAYSQINSLLKASGLKTLSLKHELVEIALIQPPPAMENLAVTLMDGAFFSSMPYPSANAYSLTHVRYTPHFGWTDDTSSLDAYATLERLPRETRWRHMINDARRYVPALDEAKWRTSLFDVKTVPVKNEHDDGRPILLHAHADIPGFWSILGSKIDNIYDLYEAVG